MTVTLFFPNRFFPDLPPEQITDDERLFFIRTRYPFCYGATRPVCMKEYDGWVCNREDGHEGPHVAYLTPTHPRAMWYEPGQGEVTRSEAMLRQAMWACMVDARLRGVTVGDCLWTLTSLVEAIGRGELT